MGDSPNNPSILKDKLLNSKKNQTHKPNDPTHISVSATTAVDKETNVSPPTGTSNTDNVTNDLTFKPSDQNNANVDSTDATNHIQSDPNEKSPSIQNNSSETDKNNFGKKTFAETTLKINTPKKEQAIIFESIDNIPQIEYVIAISKIIPPKNIKFVSRISNNRFCVYFNDKNTVDLLIKNHPIIKLNDLTPIKIRRLVNPTKRIIISNVSPAISNDKIIVELQNRNIQLLSPITHINAGFNIKDLAHILSFRRQVYINHDDFHKIPDSLLIKAENELHRIFLTDDTPTCYKCKLTGHTSKLCKNPTPDPPNAMLYESSDLNNTTINTNITDEKSGHIVPSIVSPSTNANIPSDTSKVQNSIQTSLLDDPIMSESTQEYSTLIPTSETKKRPALSSTSSSITTNSPSPKPSSQVIISNDIITPNANSKKTPQPKSKKIKRTNSLEQIILKLDEVFDPVKTYFSETPGMKINYDQFKYIIENTLSSPDPTPTLEQFNIAEFEIIEVIENIKPKLKNQSIKNRLSRLCSTLLDKALETEPIKSN